MKQFFKYFFAALLAIVVFLLLVFAFFGISATVFSSDTGSISSNSILRINLDRNIPEKTNNASFNYSTMTKTGASIGVHRIVDLIDEAADDSNIKGILIDGNSTATSFANQSMIRDAIKRFKASEKFVYAYADYYSQGGYYVSSVADSVFLQPVGGVLLKGFATMTPFFKDLMEKVGVEADVYYAGDYKSASEPIRRSSMSEPNRIQTREFLDEYVDFLVSEVAEARNLSKSDINNIMNEMSAWKAQNTVDLGLVDRLMYHDEMKKLLQEKTGRNDKKLRYVSIDKYHKVAKKKKSLGKNKVAVLFAEGSVVYGGEAKGKIDNITYLKAVEKIKKDDKIKAVVLRVNSGGGSSLTSEIIWRAMEDLKASGKKLVASFGSVAASGGYYIACGADHIFAQPKSLTGSIGVFGVDPNLSDLVTDKLGVNFDTLKTHRYSVGGSMFLDKTPGENKLIQGSIDEVYEIFLDRVGRGRNMTREEVHRVAQGRIWTGTRAKENGLVDELGGLEDAIQYAAGLADISDKYSLKYYPIIKESFVTKVLENANISSYILPSALQMSEDERKMLDMYQEMKSIYMVKEPQTRMPYMIIE